MKKTYLSLCLAMFLGISAKTMAQVAPPAENLTHQWTFDDGTVNDSKGTLNGSLVDGATVTNKALNTTGGGYVNLDASSLAINTYSELTVEVWFTSLAGANSSFHMLYYFGNTNTGGGGENYTCITPARGNNVSRAMISTGTGGSGAENGVNGPEYDDGIQHHMVAAINATSITYFIDGINMGTADLSGTNGLAALGTQFAYFAKGGYKADPTWKGLIHKISVYNKALTDDNVAYLYMHGAEEQAVITPSVTSLAFDSNYNAQVITVSSANLTGNISVTAPAGISVNPKTLTANTANSELTVVYDGSTAVNGDIKLQNGSTTVSIPVKAVSDANCFVPLYQDNINLIVDPGMNTLGGYNGWGTKELATLNTDPSNVYCGASSIKVGNGTSGGSGSLDLHFTGATSLLPNTTYKIKVMAKTDGPFQLGVERVDVNNSANNVILKSINTNGEWKPIELTFSTGAVLGSDQVIYLNDWNLSGTVGYFDNWEMYAVPDQVITTTTTGIAFDPDLISGTFNVTGGNLENDIVITAPAGITVSPDVLPASAASEPILVTYDGTTTVDGDITITSGTAVSKVKVKSATNSCFSPLYTDRPNLIPDPYLNDKNSFKGWGTWSILSAIDNPDSVYCGSHGGQIKINGDIEVPLAGKLMPKYTYISKAMIRTVGGPFQMGIAGHDYLLGDVTKAVDTNGEWQEFTFEFNSGDTVKAGPVIFFNNFEQTGKYAQIDNWQLFAKEAYTSGVSAVKQMTSNVYVANGRIVAEFNLSDESDVQLTVYNAQGAMVAKEEMAGVAGRNSKVLNANLSSGVYIVKIAHNGGSVIKKVIK